MRQQVAAIAVGLLWLAVSPCDAAARKPSAHPPVSKAAKAVKKTPRHTPHHAAQAPGEEIATAYAPAELGEEPAPGLQGKASFYGHGFQGRRTSSGERFNVREFTAASNHFPLGSMVAVQRLDSGLCAIVKVNDRMGHRGRVIDVSRGVADYLDMIRQGVALVRVAPLRHNWREKGLSACHGAFDPVENCRDCERPPVQPHLPGLDSTLGDSQ